MHASFPAVGIGSRSWLFGVATGFVLALGSLLAAPALADPPGRVGRLGDLQGQVWMYSPEAGEWINAVRNRPVTTGDRVATDGGAHAEVQVGSSTLRLDGSTELEVLQLDDDTMRYQLHGGSVAARLRTREAAREFELHTAEGRFRAQSAGHFRFDRIDEISHVTAWRGQLLFEGDGTAVTVMSDQRAEVWKDPRTQYTLTAPVRDAFSDWVAARDQADERSASTRYVSPEMTGVEDLDRHGRWEQSPEYGPLWIPYAVSPGWAPYRYGHWTYIRPWGWTWVDDARWGFAPFHYGRWVRHRGAWCWAPGNYVARPVYAPALVGWIGGPRASFSIGIGSGPSVGWFPLGPREFYVPGYAVSPRYAHNVNVTHIGNNPDGAVQRPPFVNRGPHGVTVVPSTVVMNRQPVGPAMALTTDPNVARQITGAPVQAQPPVAAPTEPPRIDVRRGVPRERTHGPMVGGPNAAHAPDQAFGRTRVPGSSVPLAAPVAPATPPPPVTPTPPAATPTPPAAAVVPPGVRVWRGDEHVGHAPPRVRRGAEAQPSMNTSPGVRPAAPTPSPREQVVAPPVRPVTPPAAPPPAAVAAPPARPVTPVPAETSPASRGQHDGRLPLQVRQEQIRPFISRPVPQPVQPAPAPPQVNVPRPAPPTPPPSQGRERRSDQPQADRREERRDDRGRRG
jgi:hypothetical protein